MNPKDFQPNAVIESRFSGKRYTVVVPDKNGMAKLRNEYGDLEDWNAYNNPHFSLSTNQMRIF